jgi:hypothetical protein
VFRIISGQAHSDQS